MPKEAISLLEATRSEGEASCHLDLHGIVIYFDLQQMTQTSYKGDAHFICRTRRIQRFTEHARGEPVRR